MAMLQVWEKPHNALNSIAASNEGIAYPLQDLTGMQPLHNRGTITAHVSLGHVDVTP